MSIAIKWTPTKLLRAAREKLNDGGKHWVKNTFRSGGYADEADAAYCSLGGIEAVLELEPGTLGAADAIPKEAQPAIIALANAVREERGYRSGVKDIDQALDEIIEYNDAPKTVWADVSRVFKRAAARPARYIEKSPARVRKSLGY